MKTTIGIITAVVMSVTVVGCGADLSNDQAKPVNQTLEPAKADPPDGGSDAKTRSVEPLCRDHVACPRPTRP